MGRTRHIQLPKYYRPQQHGNHYEWYEYRRISTYT